MYNIKPPSELGRKVTMQDILELALHDNTIHSHLTANENGEYSEHEMLINMIYVLCIEKNIYINNLREMYSRR